MDKLTRGLPFICSAGCWSPPTRWSSLVACCVASASALAPPVASYCTIVGIAGRSAQPGEDLSAIEEKVRSYSSEDVSHDRLVTDLANCRDYGGECEESGISDSLRGGTGRSGATIGALSRKHQRDRAEVDLLVIPCLISAEHRLCLGRWR